MSFWLVLSTIIGGMAVGQYVAYVKIRDGEKALNALFWGKVLLVVSVAVLVVGFVTNKLIADVETRFMARAIFWFVLFLFTIWKTKGVSDNTKPE